MSEDNWWDSDAGTPRAVEVSAATEEMAETIPLNRVPPMPATDSMPQPEELLLNTNLLHPSRSPTPYRSSPSPYRSSPSPYRNGSGGPTSRDISSPADNNIPEWCTYHHDHNHTKIDRNSLKRNMTIAKGFLDISLLSANSNQLKYLLDYGNRNSYSFYISKTGIITSIFLQLITGVLLILMERWNINKPHHKVWALRLNNAVLCMVFLTLITNVFVSSFGVDVMSPSQQTNFYKGILRASFNNTQGNNGVHIRRLLSN